ncbi:hypothetical protein MJO28_012014 [Puccinia striiformis f. sp. tritici]|uniref:Uncharacterized protein n=1 Tax=Puccinia striiformis f. sp. tritici TaxID=168172 RepID=A0ACC0DZ03_9BASI|nr:hypothetical protein MJO28_012014 [Puccinia striiformis f. sp. tritici]KAI7946093.1 hypothetical protein MJO29_012481 [Puccinia striiformis f. sp. tritici]
MHRNENIKIPVPFLLLIRRLGSSSRFQIAFCTYSCVQNPWQITFGYSNSTIGATLAGEPPLVHLPAFREARVTFAHFLRPSMLFVISG